jgi:hypothetical protein
MNFGEGGGHLFLTPNRYESLPLAHSTTAFLVMLMHLNQYFATSSSQFQTSNSISCMSNEDIVLIVSSEGIPPRLQRQQGTGPSS